MRDAKTLHTNSVSIKTYTMNLLDDLFEPFLWGKRDKCLDGFPMMSSPMWAAGKVEEYQTYNMTLLV